MCRGHRVLRRRFITRTGGEVANAAACKAVIHGFESHPVLQIREPRAETCA